MLKKIKIYFLLIALLSWPAGDILASSTSTGSLQDISYTYDDNGNIVQITDSSDTILAKSVIYDYDDLNRLTSATVNYINPAMTDYSRVYSYDSIGNMTSNSSLGAMNYNNSQPHQLSSYANKTLSYDNAGNVLNNGYNEFTYDYRSRMDYSRVLNQAEKTYYEYDHNNQRYLKYTTLKVFHPYPCEYEPEGLGMPLGSPISEDLEGGGMELNSNCGGYYSIDTIDSDKYIEKYFEKDLSNNTKDHVYLGNMKLATVNNSSNPYYIISDHLGSSSILTDSNGNIAQVTDYESYGKMSYENIAQNLDNSYKFTGQEYDDENALQYFGARYMDNNLGRFYAVDPAILILHDGQKLKEITKKELEELLSNPQVLNSYVYSLNNPVVYVDPDGQFGEDFNRQKATESRMAASFFHRAADYTSSQGGFINKASGFVAHAIGDFMDNVANVYDPDQKSTTRLFALGMVALDASSGGEGKVVKKGLTSLDDTFVKAAEHALEKSHFAGKSLDEVKAIAKDTYENFDIKATINGVKKYFYRAKDNILFINNPTKPTIFQPKDGLDYLRRAIKRDILEGGGVK